MWPLAGTVMALGVGMYYWYTRRPDKHVGQRVRGSYLACPHVLAPAQFALLYIVVLGTMHITRRRCGEPLASSVSHCCGVIEGAREMEAKAEEIQREGAERIGQKLEQKGRQTEETGRSIRTRNQ